MKDNERKYKISKTISIVSICLCVIAIIISAMHLRYTIVNDYDSTLATTTLLCMISVFCANLTIFLASNRKYKNSIK
jgi:hypothetical protein